MACEAWCRLVARYRSAVNAYNQAANDLNLLPGPDFSEAWYRAERARAFAIDTRSDLLLHEHDHDCFQVGQHNGNRRMSGIETENMVLGDQGQSGG